jgi:hypothetical protein
MPILEKYCYPPSLQEMAAAKLGEGLYVCVGAMSRAS